MPRLAAASDAAIAAGADRLRQLRRGQLPQPLGGHEPPVDVAQGSGRHRHQLRQRRPLPPVTLPHQRADGRISFEAIAGGLGHLRGVGGVEEIERVIKIHRITAERGQIHGQALQQSAIG